MVLTYGTYNKHLHGSLNKRKHEALKSREQEGLWTHDTEISTWVTSGDKVRSNIAII